MTKPPEPGSLDAVRDAVAQHTDDLLAERAGLRVGGELSPDTAERVSDLERERMSRWGRPRRKLEGWPKGRRS